MEYIPELTKQTSDLYEEYVSVFNEDPFSDTTIRTGKQVMESIAKKRRNTCHALQESTDMTKIVRKHGQQYASYVGNQLRQRNSQRSLQIKSPISFYLMARVERLKARPN